MRRWAILIVTSTLLTGLALLWAWSESRQGSLRAVSSSLLSLSRALARTASLLPEQRDRKTIEHELRQIWAADLSPYEETELHFQPGSTEGGPRGRLVLADGHDSVVLARRPDGRECLEATTESPRLGSIRVLVYVDSVDELLRHELWPWVGLAVFGSGIVLPGLTGYFWKRQHDQREAGLRALSRGLQKAREGEATRIARDLHDDLGQLLSLLKLELSRQGNEGQLQLVTSALASLRQVIRGLRPVLLDEAGLYAAIEWKAREIEGESGVALVLRLHQPEAIIPSEQRFALFRIVQELVTNSLKHAHPEQIIVEFTPEAGLLKVSVSDDGPGFPQTPQATGNHGLGLPGVRERVAEMGGRVVCSNTPGAKVTIEIPLLSE